jgi:hypothetical protein
MVTTGYLPVMPDLIDTDIVSDVTAYSFIFYNFGGQRALHHGFDRKNLYFRISLERCKKESHSVKNFGADSPDNRIFAECRF